jgi:transglutaminase-like putative cysteine protease
LTCLLRRYGFPAQCVIGVRNRPFAAHAWVELYGSALGELEDVRKYAVIERV